MKTEHYKVYFDYMKEDGTWSYNNTWDFYAGIKGKHFKAQKVFYNTEAKKYKACRVTKVVYQ